MSLAPGTRLGAYEIVSALGAGGMSACGQAERERGISEASRRGVIKVLPDSLRRLAPPQKR